MQTDNGFSQNELFDIEYAVDSLIKDKREYCTNIEDVADDIERLEELQAKIQGLLRNGR